MCELGLLIITLVPCSLIHNPTQSFLLHYSPFLLHSDRTPSHLIWILYPHWFPTSFMTPQLFQIKYILNTNFKANISILERSCDISLSGFGLPRWDWIVPALRSLTTNFIFPYRWELFHRLNTTHLSDLFINWWVHKLFLFLSYCE